MYSIVQLTMIFSVSLIMFQKSSFGKSFGKNDTSLDYFSQNEHNYIKLKTFSLPEDDFLMICCCITLFILIAVFIIFGLIFYGEAQEFKKRKNEQNSTQMSENSRTYLCSTKLTNQKLYTRDIELTTPSKFSKLETIPEVQIENISDEKC